MTISNHCEQTVGTPDPGNGMVIGLRTRKLVERPNHPGVERVVAGTVGDVGDLREKLTVEGDTRGLDTKWIEAFSVVRFL